MGPWGSGLRCLPFLLLLLSALLCAPERPRTFSPFTSHHPEHHEEMLRRRHGAQTAGSSSTNFRTAFPNMGVITTYIITFETPLIVDTPLFYVMRRERKVLLTVI